MTVARRIAHSPFARDVRRNLLPATYAWIAALVFFGVILAGVELGILLDRMDSLVVLTDLDTGRLMVVEVPSDAPVFSAPSPAATPGAGQ